jgi:hypothetical protein
MIKTPWTLKKCRGINLRDESFAARLTAANDAISMVAKGGGVRSASRFRDVQVNRVHRLCLGEQHAMR